MLFPFEFEHPPPDSALISRMKNQIFKDPKPEHIKRISKYFNLRSDGSLNNKDPVLQNSITNLDKVRSLEAIKFNKKLVEVIKGDVQSQKAKLQFYQSIQELFEEFII